MNVKDELYTYLQNDDSTSFNKLRTRLIRDNGYEWWRRVYRQVLLRQNAERYDFIKLVAEENKEY